MMIDPEMMEIRAELEDNNTNAELKRLLENALGDEYTEEVNSQRNDIIEAFFRKVGTNPNKVKLKLGDTTYEDLMRGERHRLAKALGHYLANQGIRARKPTQGLTKDVLSSMITAIRVSEKPQKNNVSYPDPYPLPSESTELSDAEKGRLSQWLEDSCGDFRDKYAVYVLDCTLPPEGERSLSQQYRIQQAYDLIESQSRDLNHKDREVKKAAEAEKIYYVGQTNDVLDRIDRHLAGTGKGGGSWFTHTLNPNYLEEVYWYATETESCEGEKKVANEIMQRDESNHVYWN